MFFNKHSKGTHSLCTMQTSRAFFEEDSAFLNDSKLILKHFVLDLN